MKNEIWKDIPGYEGYYQASDLGQIRSLRFKGKSRIKIRKPHLDKYGYLCVGLIKENKKNTRTVHRLVAKAFLGISDLVVNHKNGIKIDNTVENLEYITVAENNRHAYRTGLQDNKNEKLRQSQLKLLSKNHQNAKLTEDEVLEIRKVYAEGGISQRKLGLKYGVTQGTIFDVVNFRSWNKLSDLS
mgnify:CR=1 FL=1